MASKHVRETSCLRCPKHRNESFRTKLDEEYEIIENGNRYVDQLLECLIGNEKTDIDPYCLENIILNIGSSTGVKIHNGQVTGLQTLHRAGDCCFTKTVKRFHINADIAASDVTIRFNVTVRLKCLAFKVAINLHFGYIQIITHLSIVAKSAQDAIMYRFQVADMHDMVLSVDVYKPVDWLLNKIIRATIWLFNRPIKKLMAHLIERRIRYALSYFVFPMPTHYGSMEMNKPSMTIAESEETCLSQNGKETEISVDSKK